MSKDKAEYYMGEGRPLITRAKLRRAWILDQVRRLKEEYRPAERDDIETMIREDTNPARAKSYSEVFALVADMFGVLRVWGELDADIQRIAQEQGLTTAEVIKAALRALKQGYHEKEVMPMVGPSSASTAPDEKAPRN